MNILSAQSQVKPPVAHKATSTGTPKACFNQTLREATKSADQADQKSSEAKDLAASEDQQAEEKVIPLVATGLVLGMIAEAVAMEDTEITEPMANAPSDEVMKADGNSVIPVMVNSIPMETAMQTQSVELQPGSHPTTTVPAVPLQTFTTVPVSKEVIAATTEKTADGFKQGAVQQYPDDVNVTVASGIVDEQIVPVINEKQKSNMQATELLSTTTTTTGTDNKTFIPMVTAGATGAVKPTVHNEVQEEAQISVMQGQAEMGQAFASSLGDAAEGQHQSQDGGLNDTVFVTGMTTTVKEASSFSLEKPDIQPPVKEQVLQHIAQKANFVVNGAHQEMRMQLRPENLGAIQLQVIVENGTVTAKFQTENAQVKHLLESSMQQLKQELHAQGFKVENVSVNIGHQAMSFSDFSRREPQFTQVKSKRVIKEQDAETAIDSLEQAVRGTMPQHPLSNGVDYKV